MWVTKKGRRHVGAKRIKSTKKAVYAIFFSCDGIAIQVPVTKGKSATRRYNCYMYVVLKKLKFTTRHDVYVCLLHDNAPAHTLEIVKPFLKSKKVTVLRHMLY